MPFVSDGWVLAPEAVVNLIKDEGPWNICVEFFINNTISRRIAVIGPVFDKCFERLNDADN